LGGGTAVPIAAVVRICGIEFLIHGIQFGTELRRRIEVVIEIVSVAQTVV
jgi:hypothetical protein